MDQRLTIKDQSIADLLTTIFHLHFSKHYLVVSGRHVRSKHQRFAALATLRGNVKYVANIGLIAHILHCVFFKFAVKTRFGSGHDFVCRISSFRFLKIEAVLTENRLR